MYVQYVCDRAYGVSEQKRRFYTSAFRTFNDLRLKTQFNCECLYEKKFIFV